MCGRYSITTPAQAMQRVFSFKGPTPNLQPRWNVAPTQDVPVIRKAEGGRELKMLRWGLVPYWADDISGASRMINARGETVAEKPAYRAAFKSRRCLVPADGFYEWPEHGPLKGQPVLFRQRDEGPFAFAGLWERWVPKNGEVLETFTIVNTAANELMTQYHHRVPIVLDPKDYDAWLDPEFDARTLLKAPPGAWFTATPVSTYVNNVRNDDPGCFAPAADAPVPQEKPAKGKKSKTDERQTRLF